MPVGWSHVGEVNPEISPVGCGSDPRLNRGRIPLPEQGQKQSVMN